MFLDMLCQSLREVCATLVDYIKQQFGVFVSRFVFDEEYGHAVVLNQRNTN